MENQKVEEYGRYTRLEIPHEKKFTSMEETRKAAMEMAKEEDEKTKESSEDAPEVSRGYGVVGSSRAPVMPSEKIPIKSDLVMIDWSDEKMIHERSLIEETR